MTGDPTARTRAIVYGLLTTVTVAAVCARIVSVERVYEPSIYRPTEKRTWPPQRPAVSPTLSSNDKSRWATVRALVDEGTFVIGQRERLPDGTFRDTGIVFDDGWQSIDKVLHPETSRFYSSKPPLLPVLVAGEYWLLQKLFGLRLAEHTGAVVAIVLVTVNAVPLAIYLLVLARLIERYGRSDFGRLFVFTAACFGTFITTFANTFNNHTVAAFTTLFAVAPLLMGGPSLRGCALSGLFAGLTACFELPALALVAALGCVLLRFTHASPRVATRGLRGRNVSAAVFILAALVPIAAQVALNKIAIGEWMPAYEKIESVWYRYEGSHWASQGSGIDYAGLQETRPTYAFHLLLGHHGLFSLTPIWLLLLLRFAPEAHGLQPVGLWRSVHIATAAVSVIVIVFYAAIVGTVNYGGWTCGPRWFFWLTPLWLLALVPAADRLGESRFGRGLALSLLALSIFSAHTSQANPWRHPWIYNAMMALGWKGY